MSAMFVKPLALSAAVVLGLGTMASAATVVVARFQNSLADPFTGTTYEGTEDTFLNGGATTAKNLNYGADTVFVATNTRNEFALLRFDLSSMQGKFENISSASLFLRPSGTLYPNDTISVYSVLPVNGDWVGGVNNGGTVATDGSSTWYSKHSYGADPSDQYLPGPNNVPWKDANGNDVYGLGVNPTDPTDTTHWGFGPTALASASGKPVSGVTIRLDLPVSLVESWINGSNNGLVVTSTNAAAGDVPTFYSGNKNNTAAPELVLNYVVPEPMTGSLLLIGGGLLALRRRRRVA